jgi:hypothetical protein
MANSFPNVLEQAEILYLGRDFQVGKRNLLVRFPHPLKASFELGQVRGFTKIYPSCSCFNGPSMRQDGAEVPPLFLKCRSMKAPLPASVSQWIYLRRRTIPP